MNRPTGWRAFTHRLGCGLLAILAGPLYAANGGSVEELQAAGRLQVEGTLTPARGIVPGQQVTLTLALATDRWFTGGTRITIPEVPGLVILQTQQFASNSSETRNGQSWVVQRWALDIYPQRTGEFSLPPIQLRVKVNVGEAGDVEGQVSSNPVGFEVEIPDNLSQAERWVAAPTFEVRQSFDRSLEALQTGDAFEREIVFEASDVLAMMLPTAETVKIPGLAAYPSPPVLDNSSNRGQTRASRIQRISYVVEAQGEYTLPALEYFWWDTENSELRLLSLPATEISVGTGVPGPAGSPFEDLHITRSGLLATAAGLVLLGAGLWLAWKRLPTLPTAQISASLSGLVQRLKALRKPALPSRLNPGSNAGE